jgi:hypothetical protein
LKRFHLSITLPKDSMQKRRSLDLIEETGVFCWPTICETLARWHGLLRSLIGLN